jgi:hypothetical protein
MEIREPFMSQEDFFNDARAQFSIVGPQISEAEINAVFTWTFPGKDDLVQFYLLNNGGSRSEQGSLAYCGNPEHQASRDHLEKIRIEGFFAIPHDPGQKMLKYRSMIKYYASRLQTFSEIPEMKAFLESHRPIASDHTGNDCWIDIQSGRVQYILWDTWKEGPIEIASSFREFVTKFWNNGFGGCPTDPPSSS